MGRLREGRQDVESESLTLKLDVDEVPAFHARPEGMPVGGLVLHPDINGLTAEAEEIARRLASRGLAVCAIEPFFTIDPEERAQLDADGHTAAVRDLVDAEQLAALARAADHLVVHDDVATVAMLGFCFGGMYTLKAAAQGRFDRAVDCYGMIRVPERWRGPGQSEPLDHAADVCPTIAILGGQDDFTPPADIEALREAWSDRPDCEIVVYPEARHGFIHAPERPTHRPDDAVDAWRRILTFLGADADRL
ncbi:MAG: dienelactone hydrolase-like enzyme [Actinomycetia bacterium]|nr:dienelactone hydrolase-like enzyme [Actinomycetes bacterium]